MGSFMCKCGANLEEDAECEDGLLEILPRRDAYRLDDKLEEELRSMLPLNGPELVSWLTDHGYGGLASLAPEERIVEMARWARVRCLRSAYDCVDCGRFWMEQEVDGEFVELRRV